MRHDNEKVSVNTTQPNHQPTTQYENNNKPISPFSPATRQPSKCIDFDSSPIQTPACRCRKLLSRRTQIPNHCYYCEQQQQQQQQQQQNEQCPYPNKKTSLDTTADYLQVYNTLPNNYFCDQNQQKQLQLCLDHRKSSSLSIKMSPNGDSDDPDSNSNNNNSNNGGNDNDSPGDERLPGDEDGHNTTNDLELNIDLEQTYYPEKVFWCLKRRSPWRHWAIKMTLSPYFERITIFIILMNCVTLGLYDPYDELCATRRCKVLEGMETFIYAYFFAEMLIKMVALGIFGKEGYLSEGWNRLDFFIVVAGTFELVYGDGEFLSSVRAVRVLRPLRAINRVPSIRILVTLLLDTLPMLGNVFILCVLILMVFAIIGVQLWHGILRNRCTLDLPPSMPSHFFNSSTFPKEKYYIPPNSDEWSLICPAPEEGSKKSPLMCFTEIPSLDLTKFNCTKIYGPQTNLSQIPANETNCVNWNRFYSSCQDVGQNPQYGAISFDNSGEAFIAIFQAMTLEGWVDIMYYLQDAHSSWVWVYFVALIVLGSYFLTNLCLVVVATQFSETRQRESALMEEARRKARSTSSTIFTATDTESKGCYNQILSIMKHYIQRGCRRLKTRLFGEKNVARRKKKGRHLLQKSGVEGGEGGRNKRLHVNGGGGVHYHHHHHHHIHHHHLHLCNSNSMAAGTMATRANTNNAIVNGDLNVYGDDARYCPNAASIDKKKKAAMVTNEANGSTNKTLHAHGQTVPSSTTIKPAPPSIIIDEVNSCDLQPLPTRRMNTTTALIIPDTTVVICHSSSLPGALQSQSPLTTVSLYPSLSKIHHRSSMNETDFDNDQTACMGRYRSVGDPQCCPDLNKDLDKYERDVLNESDLYDSDDEYDSDDDLDWETNAEKRERQKNKWMNKKRLMIVQFCESDCFKVSIMTAIFLNTVTMAMEHYRQPESMTMALEIFNTIFTTVFLIEFVLKFTGYGFYGYIKNAFNVFDGIVVIISIIELAGSRAGGVSVLRTFRLMRIFKLIRFLPTLQKQIQVMLETLDSVMTFLGLLTIFIFTSSILGMHLFGGRMRVDGVPVRHNFDDLLWSLITVFQVLTQEDWNAVLYDAMRSTSKWAAVYFILLMIIGNYILFNLLVAILVEGFSSETEGILSTPSKSPLLKNQTLDTTGVPDSYYEKDKKNIFDPINKINENKSQSLPNITDEAYYLDDINNIKLEEGLMNGFTNVAKYRRMSSSESAIHRQVRFNTEIKIKPIPDEDETKDLEDNEARDDEKMLRDDDVKEEKKETCCRINFFIKRKDWSLYIFSPKNKARMAASDLVAHQWFDNVVLFFILMNCIIMALERPSIKPGSTERKIIDISNHVFTIVFTIEMVIKIFAAGFYFGEKTTYLKNSWNRIDFVLVIISLVDIFVTYVVQSKSGVLGVLKVFRAFRTLRPLRVISRAPGLKIVVETLIHSLVPIGNLLIVGLVFFTIFGILGVQLFKGKFHHCTGVEDDQLESVVTRTDCIAIGGRWTNKKYNFDNLFQALFTLFVFSTKDGWVALMYDGIDAVGIDKQPKRNANRWAFLYFVAFLLIAGFVVINMVVGVIIDNFQKCRVLVEEEEIEAGHTMISSHPASDEDDIPKHLDEYSYARRNCYDIVSHYKFDLVIAVIIGLNVLMMAIEHDKMSVKMVALLSILNYIFTTIFILEAIFKIWGFGPRMFFAQRWNQLDIVIVFLSIIGIIFEELNSELPINPTIIRIMRVLRIARVLKILKAADGIQKLLNCVTEAIPQVGNLSMLFLLIFFIYSALGIELFGDLDCNLDTCFGISRHAHFENFGYALLTLFRVSTGDNWSGLLKDCINEKLCPEPCPMMPYMAPVYFSTFVLASQFVLVNVVVAVLMKQLEDAKELVSPSTSQDSGLNSPDTTQVVNYGDDNINTGAKNIRDNVELTLRRHGHLKSPDSTCDESKPLIASENTELDYDNFSVNLVALEQAKETPIDVPGSILEAQDTPFNGNTNHDPLSISQPKETGHVNDQFNNKDTDCVQNLRSDENNKPPTSEVTDSNSNNADNVEQTVNDLVEMVVKNEAEKPNNELDCLDLDIIATVEALSGLRDSVLSTCV